MSEKIMIFKILETFFSLLIYKINRIGPRIDPLGTQHIIYWNDVFSLSLITTHCYQLLR